MSEQSIARTHFLTSLRVLSRLTKHDLQCEGLDLSDSEWERFAADRVAYTLEITSWAQAAIWDAVVARALRAVEAG